MKRNVLAGTLLGVVVLLGSAVSPVSAFAATAGATTVPDARNGQVIVSFTTPTGVPGAIDINNGTKHVAAKAPAGTSGSVTLTLAQGVYQVSPQAVTFGGRVYTGHSFPEVTVRAGGTSKVSVNYTGVATAQDLAASDITQTSLSLSWTAPAGATFALRRTLGSSPATTNTQGTAVPTTGNAATDKGLQSGTQYTYSLFTRINGALTGPIAVTAGTASAPGSTSAAYIAPSSTLLAKSTDIVSVATTGSGVHVQLGTQVRTPLLGSAIVLPQSDILTGGFLGVVTTLSEDGRGVDLVAGGMTDAFDYYNLSVANFASVPVAPAVAQPNAFSNRQSPTPSPEERSATAPLTAKSLAPATALANCDGSTTKEVTFKPSMSLGGHFNAKIDKYHFLGQSIPTGASLDMELTATVTGAITLKTAASMTCSLNLPSNIVTITTSPIPISFYFETTAQFTAEASLEVNNVGWTATAGVQVSGSMGLKSGSSFSGKPIFSASPLTPVIAANGKISAKLGGKVVVGPGAGTKGAGVIAGVGGDLDLLDANLAPQFPITDLRFNQCLVADAKTNLSLNLTAKAWVGDWDITKVVDIPALKGSFPYPGSPWYLPTGCKGIPPVQPGDTLLGVGVTKVTDVTTGSASQWGHLDGFAPGQKTWVLSTGLIANAVGAPGQFASTDLGGAGDTDLTALAGHPTFDAASYQVTLIPTGSTLHVKYAFASEEYPEYVGTQFNDAMEVLVNGVNCATVPGTSSPVSVNNVNIKTNSQYFVDNSAGAAGYSTSMDGITVPLTCAVPVTPGKAVTVRIAVADSADHIYDSAVALVDKGIWTD